MTSNSNRPANQLAYDMMSWGANLSLPPPTSNIKPPPKRSNRPTKRTTFTPEQVKFLELEFAKNEYICKDRRNELAQIIDLTECQVKTWFQNRRTKKRRCISPIRKELMMKQEERSPSPYSQEPPFVSNLHALFQGRPTHFEYSLSADQTNKSA